MYKTRYLIEFVNITQKYNLNLIYKNLVVLNQLFLLSKYKF